MSLFFLLQGGEIVQETITSSVGDDTCSLEFQRSDGTLVTKLIDFKSKPQHRYNNRFLLVPVVGDDFVVSHLLCHAVVLVLL
ncbi:hypothetical protein ZHAS_00004252 [Anopheles sinensis]|uniref:Out at first protein BRICHOS-like domain-containing protein n=1 Tax=Anopheles sinensis TaxID=74873 RepID=A0A084VGG2_ANOSI|nr:hypothetical protein ZHAS_00004252 [Anopheles sinensis]